MIVLDQQHVERQRAREELGGNWLVRAIRPRHGLDDLDRPGAVFEALPGQHGVADVENPQRLSRRFSVGAR